MPALFPVAQALAEGLDHLDRKDLFQVTGSDCPLPVQRSLDFHQSSGAS